MKKFLLGMAVSVILMLFMGCAIIGKDFDSDKAKQIKIGVTTRGDIERVFGKPFKTGVQNGQPIWF